MDCRSPDQDGRDLWVSAGVCRGLWGSVGICEDLQGSMGDCRDLWGSVGVCGGLWGLVGIGRHLWVTPDIYGGYLLTSVGVSGNRSNDIYT